MAEQTNISWTDRTFNPWIGCTKISGACEHCYAEVLNTFYRWNPSGWGPRANRHRTSVAIWKRVYHCSKVATKSGVRHRAFCVSLANVADDNPSIQDAGERIFSRSSRSAHHWTGSC